MKYNKALFTYEAKIHQFGAKLMKNLTLNSCHSHAFHIAMVSRRFKMDHHGPFRANRVSSTNQQLASFSTDLWLRPYFSNVLGVY